MTDRLASGTSQNGQKSGSGQSQTWGYVALGVGFGLLFPLAATFLKLRQDLLPLTFSSIVTVQRSELLLWIIDTAPLFLGLFAGLAGRRQDVLLKINADLVSHEDEISSLRANLEGIVDERTKELEGRNLQLSAAVQFSREIAKIEDPATLLSTAADVIRDRFGYPWVGIFLLDQAQHEAILQATSSAVGRQRLEAGYTVQVGDQSLVGRAAGQGTLIRTAVPGGAGPSASKADAPDPRSEIAIPLIMRGKVGGVLHLQSDIPGTFRQTEIEILQILADQIATSTDNLRLLAESRDVVNELEVLTTQRTRLTWREFLQGQKIAYQFTPAGIRPIGPNAKPEKKDGLTIPLIQRGQEIGSIILRRRDSSHWLEAERDLAEKIAAQVSLALDNSRLLDETRQRAVQEQTVNEISARLSRSLEIDALLQTAARELGTLPDVAEVSVVLAAPVEKKPASA